MSEEPSARVVPEERPRLPPADPVPRPRDADPDADPDHPDHHLVPRRSSSAFPCSGSASSPPASPSSRYSRRCRSAAGSIAATTPRRPGPAPRWSSSPASAFGRGRNRPCTCSASACCWASATCSAWPAIRCWRCARAGPRSREAVARLLHGRGFGRTGARPVRRGMARRLGGAAAHRTSVRHRPHRRDVERARRAADQAGPDEGAGITIPATSCPSAAAQAARAFPP